MKQTVLVLAAIFILAWSATAVADTSSDVATQMVQLESRPGVYTRCILYQPEEPVGTVILFPDGNGLLGISHVFNTTQLGSSDDIPYDLMDQLLDHGIAVVLMDAPSDHDSMLGVNGWQGSHIFRLSREHAQDIGTVVAYLKQEALRPIWLAGIRMGAFSATTAAIHLQEKVAGLVIAGGITQCPKQHILLQLCPSGLMGMPLHEISIPTLILSGGEVFPDPLLASALNHAPNIRFQIFPEFATFENWVGWDATRTVLPGVSNAYVSREIADFMHWNAMMHPVMICDKPPEDMAPLEIYLAYCYF